MWQDIEMGPNLSVLAEDPEVTMKVVIPISCSKRSSYEICKNGVPK
jgi:hypothetical protein